MKALENNNRSRSYFEFCNPQLLHNLYCTEEGFYSVTPFGLAMETALVRHRIMQFDSYYTLDLTLGMGGDSFASSFYCDQVVGLEIDQTNFDCVTHNYDYIRNTLKYESQIDKIQIFNTDSIGYLQESLHQWNTPFCVILDPPWGGHDFKQHQNITLQLGNSPLSAVVYQLFKNQNCKVVQLKLPSNYNEEELQKISQICRQARKHIVKQKKFIFMYLYKTSFEGPFDYDYEKRGGASYYKEVYNLRQVDQQILKVFPVFETNFCKPFSLLNGSVVVISNPELRLSINSLQHLIYACFIMFNNVVVENCTDFNQVVDQLPSFVQSNISCNTEKQSDNIVDLFEIDLLSYQLRYSGIIFDLHSFDCSNINKLVEFLSIMLSQGRVFWWWLCKMNKCQKQIK